MKNYLTTKLYIYSISLVIASVTLFMITSGKIKMPMFSSGKPNPNLITFQEKPWKQDPCKAERTIIKGPVATFTWDCSTETLLEEAKKTDLTTEFTINSGLIARRVNFWKRIYLVFSSDEYVLHSSEYPEVIFEFATPLQKRTSAQQVRSQLGKRRLHYRRLTHKMHLTRHRPAKWNIEQKRIARKMSHIRDSDKYKKVSISLRRQRGQKDFLENGVATSKIYLPHIKRDFKKVGVPQELAYIAFVESSFNLKAKSKVGASGIFQIMPRVGREYLKIDRSHGIDERNDPIKAGIVAAKIFKENYRITNSWPLSITGYNHGPYGIKKIKKKLGTSDLVKMIKYHKGKSFGFASKNFYIQFLAMTEIMENEDEHFSNLDHQVPLAYSIHKLEKSRKLRWIERSFNTRISSIKKLNPDLSHRTFKRQRLPKGYIVKVAISNDGQ